MSPRPVLPAVARTELVSVIVAAGRDPAVTSACFERLRALDRPAERLEIVVVGSPGTTDPDPGPASDLRVVEVPDGTGLAAARNAGAEAARGECLAFLAVDAVPNPDWLKAAVEALRRNANNAGVASKVVGPDGTVEFAGAGMTFAGEPVLFDVEEVNDRPGETLFAAEAAMVVDGQAFRWVGGFDEALSPAVEFADLGWRLWLHGFRIAYVPASVVVGAATATDTSEAGTTRWILGSLGTLYKNYGEEGFVGALAAAMLAANATPAGRAALEPFNLMLPQLVEARRKVQAERVVGDAEIVPLFRARRASPRREGSDLSVVREALGVDRGRHRIAVVTPDVLGDQMAGPAIRAWKIAEALGREHDVQLVTTTICARTSDEFIVRHVDDGQMHEVEAWCDVLVFQGDVLGTHPWLVKSPKVIVGDIYAPMHLEVLEQSRDLDASARRHVVRITAESVNVQLARADFFLCASDKQRDFWLGQLAGVGRINPAVYDRDESLDSLVTVVPFGVEDEKPKRTAPALRGVVDGIGPDDKIVLWGGGVYNWFDPLTLIHAIARLRTRIPNVRLYFMGMQHPNPGVPTMRVATETRSLAAELGLVGQHVFFNDGWVAYDERQNYLLEADVGVSTHFEHVETAFSFRTRILDYIWASLPIVATAGDSFGEVIERRGFGITVPPEDEEALEEALYQLLSDEERNAACRAAIEAAADSFQWVRVLEPLLQFCRAPRRAADLVDPRQARMIGDPMAQAAWGRQGWRYTAARVVDHLRNREYDELRRKVTTRARVLLFPESAGPGSDVGLG